MVQSIDQLQLQRLVDAELDPVERGRFLERVAAVNGWREVALAFVEDQVWRTEFGPSVSGQASVGTCRIGAGDDAQTSEGEVSISPLDVERADAEFTVDLKNEQSSKPNSRTREQATASKSMTALLVILSAVAGFWFGEQKPVVNDSSGTIADSQDSNIDSSRENNSDSNSNQQPIDSSDNKASVVAQAAEGFRLQVTHSDGQVVEYPVFNASQFVDPVATETDLRVNQLNKQLEGLGYRLVWETEYVSRKLDDGGELVVPVQNVAMRYHGQ